MTGLDRKLLLLRELLQTPREELVHFPRRAGLYTQPSREELEQAQDLVEAIVQALGEDGGPAWQRVRDAWLGSRRRHGAPPAPGLVDPPAPAWIGAQPAKPALGDPAPGTEDAASLERQRQRFVPQAPPVSVAAAMPLALSQTPPTPPISPLRELLAAEARAQPPAPPPMPHHAAARPTGPTLPPTPVWPREAAWPPAPPVHGESYALGPAVAVGASPAVTAPPAHAPSREVRALGGVDLGAWTTSRYAALCAACSADPARAADTAREYGLPDEASRRLVADYFTDRFDRDPTEQELWERLVQQFRKRLVHRTT